MRGAGRVSIQSFLKKNNFIKVEIGCRPVDGQQIEHDLVQTISRIRKMFLKISQYSQKNTFAGVTFQ